MAFEQVVYEFDVPEEYQYEGCPKTIGVVELNYMQDKRVRSRVKTDFHRLQDEMVKESIIMLDGIDVRGIRHSVDKFWDGSGQRLRGLCTLAFQDVNNLQDDQADSFLNGKRQKA